MGEKQIFKYDSTPLGEHPALIAWKELRFADTVPESIEVLLNHEGKPPNRKSVVYRLNAVGIEGAAVIAKRTKRASVQVECVVYQEILPAVGLPSLHCYGSIDDTNDDLSWLFLEEAQGVWYNEKLAAHRALAAEWLGITHTATEMMNLTTRLPEHGPEDYLSCLRSGRTTIIENLSNPALNRDDVELLESILKRFDMLESQWSQVDYLYASMPQCLVHGDFVGKNIRVYNKGTNSVLYVMDWDIAGWGAPAVDIERQDLDAYWAVVSEAWPQFDLEKIRAMAHFGVILRNVGLIQATSIGLAYEWVYRTIQDLKVYEYRLAFAHERMGWI